MEKNQFLHLIDKYLSGQTSAEEEQMLLRFFDSFQGEENVQLKKELEEKMLQRLMRSVKPSIKRRVWQYAAAVAVLVVSISLFYYNNTIPQGQQLATENSQPNSNKALLKLADGTTIELNQAAEGVVAVQGNTIIKKTKQGQLIYEAAPGKNLHNILNTITTPKGGQYQLILPDGTLVWLNAQSSLTFPTVFDGGERRLNLTGEAYFEVTKNSKPFFVKAGDNEVAVLGTHFNVMAYADAATFETTLLEGSVLVKHGRLQQTITPGQQAIVGNTIQIKQVNTDAVMAWKEGLFVFDNTGIEDAMQQIKRWYNIAVVYEGTRPDIEFTGVLPRSSTLGQVLDLLESSAKGVHFEISNSSIIVRKKV